MTKRMGFLSVGEMNIEVERAHVVSNLTTMKGRALKRRVIAKQNMASFGGRAAPSSQAFGSRGL